MSRRDADKRRRRFSPWVLLTAIVIAGLGYAMMRPSPLGTKESLNILLVGIDGVVTAETTPGAPRGSAPVADSIALLTVNGPRREAHLLLIPGEMRALPAIDGVSEQLLTYLPEEPVAQWVDGYGAERLVRHLEMLLDVPVHFVVRWDALSFVNLIDWAGGLPFPPIDPYVPVVHPGRGESEMADGAEWWNGEAVWQHLRSDEGMAGEAGMAARIALFTGGLFRIRGEGRFIHVRLLFDHIVKHLETDMPREQLLAVVKHVYDVPNDGLTVRTLPGQFDDSGFLVDEVATAALAKRLFEHKIRPSDDAEGY